MDRGGRAALVIGVGIQGHIFVYGRPVDAPPQPAALGGITPGFQSGGSRRRGGRKDRTKHIRLIPPQKGIRGQMLFQDIYPQAVQKEQHRVPGRVGKMPCKCRGHRAGGANAVPVQDPPGQLDNAAAVPWERIKFHTITCLLGTASPDCAVLSLCVLMCKDITP